MQAVKELLKRPVAYHPILAKLTGSISAAVMLSQGMYWQTKAEENNQEWFWVTADGWNDQCGLTQNMQETAREILRRTDFWFEKRAGLPAKLYYRIDADILVSRITGYLNGEKQDYRNTGNKKSAERRTGNGRYGKQDSLFADDKESNNRLLDTNLENSDADFFSVSVFEMREEEVALPTLDAAQNFEKKSPARARATKPDRHSADDVARELSGPHLDFYCDILNTGVWADYLDYRKEIRVKPYRSAKSEAQAIMDFFKEAGGDSSKSQEIVNQSRAKGWTGLFKLKNSNNDRNGTNQVRHSTNPGNGGDFYGGGDNPMWSGVMQGDTGEWGKKYP
jgi:hypothetical protein